MSTTILQSILFICRHNSIRSQLAALLTEKISHNTIQCQSAGPEPTQVPEFMQGWALQMGQQKPLRAQPVEAIAGQHFDMIITLCDKSHQALPQLKEDQEHIQWDFQHADNPEAFKHLEIELAERIRLLLLAKGAI